MVPRRFGKRGFRAMRRHRFRPCRCTKKAETGKSQPAQKTGN
jgi:hypothetical protein